MCREYMHIDAGGLPMTEDWRLIEDEDVPRDGSWFVIWGPDDMPVACYYKTQATKGFFDGAAGIIQTGWGVENATHWKPLKPPEGEA